MHLAYYMFLQLFFFKPELGFDFELKCPESAHRQLRAKEYCKRASITKYYCLYDENYKRFVESCQEDPDHVRPGEKYIITGRRRNVNCSPERFQPFLFWSNASSVCVYVRSQCNGIGQILYNKGTNKIDKSCRCDYRKGYDFVVRPENGCFCHPAQEDCSCYLTNCSRHLSPDYKCTNEESNYIDTSCPPILFDSNDKEHNAFNTIHIEEENKDLKKQTVVRYGLSIVLLCLMLFFGFSYKLRTYSVCIEETSSCPDNLQQIYASVFVRFRSITKQRISAVK